MQDDALRAVRPIVGAQLAGGSAVITELRLGVAVGVGVGNACTRNVRGDRAALRLGRFFRPLILSPSLTVLTNLVQTVEFDGWTKTVMADVTGAVVTLVLLLPAGQRAEHMQCLERSVGGGPWPLQTTAYIDDTGVGMLADIFKDGEP